MEKIIVAGAGIIGICCALYLSRKGYQVTLIDRRQPAEEASYGNAGIICNSGIAPLASPEILKHLPYLITNRHPQFRLHWPHAISLLPWIYRFIRHCNPHSKQHCIEALSYLLANTVSDHLELLRQIGAEKYYSDTGWLRLYRTAAQFQKTKDERHQYRAHGIRFQVLSGDQVRELEPALTRRYSDAIWLDGTPSVTNPGQVCKAYAAHFLAHGGRFIQSRLDRLRKMDKGWAVDAGGRRLPCDQVVVALGASAPTLLRTVGVKPSLACERGYHLLYRPAPGVSLNRPIIDVQYGFAITPMEPGIRVTSGTNLAARHAPPTPIQINVLREEIENTLPLGRQLLDTPWMGERPSTPDSLPIIGPTPSLPGLWQAFGHGHLGLTLGPTTGKLIADSIAGKPATKTEQAFWPSRFN